jgi:hypothetical protein
MATSTILGRVGAPSRMLEATSFGGRRPGDLALRHYNTRLAHVVLRCLSTGLLYLAACGDSRSPDPTPVTCSGMNCACDAFDACTCPAGSNCETQCGSDACALTCEADAKCNGSSDASLTLTCGVSSECKGSGGDGSQIHCDGAAKCESKTGAQSVAVCNDSASCKFTLGAGSTAECTAQSSCNVKCEQNCDVECSDKATCKLTCMTGSTETPGTKCAGGRLVCGSC